LKKYNNSEQKAQYNKLQSWNAPKRRKPQNDLYAFFTPQQKKKPPKTKRGKRKKLTQNIKAHLLVFCCCCCCSSLLLWMILQQQKLKTWLLLLLPTAFDSPTTNRKTQNIAAAAAAAASAAPLSQNFPLLSSKNTKHYWELFFFGSKNPISKFPWKDFYLIFFVSIPSQKLQKSI
jgi:hypothetical protein